MNNLKWWPEQAAWIYNSLCLFTDRIGYSLHPQLAAAFLGTLRAKAGHISASTYERHWVLSSSGLR